MTSMNPALLRFGDVSVRLSVELGRADMPLRDVLSLAHGSVVTLNRLTDEMLDITANGKVVAQGEVIAQDGKFALRIVNLVGEDPGASNAAPPMQSPPAMPQTTSPTGARPAAMTDPIPTAAASASPVDPPSPQPDANGDKPQSQPGVQDADSSQLAPDVLPVAPGGQTRADFVATNNSGDLDDLLGSTLDELTGALDEIAPEDGESDGATDEDEAS